MFWSGVGGDGRRQTLGGMVFVRIYKTRWPIDACGVSFSM